MTEFLLGMAGMLAVLILLAGGAVLGWKMNSVWRERTKRALVEEATEQERQQMKAEQQAFDVMLNYNTDRAYGMVPDLSELAKGDE